MPTTFTMPKVSVLCATYNHEQFISKALRSFLEQDTSFSFEIIVRVDASTDKTLDIVRAYQRNFPNYIRVISHKVNQFKLGKRAMPELLRSARGEYVAFCDGDDYWSCTKKLQIQIDNIEACPQCIASSHKTEVLKKDGTIDRDSDLFVRRNTAALLDYADIATAVTPFHTTSFVCKISVLRPVFDNKFFGKSISGDLMIYSLAASQGRISFIPEYMSVYRVHDGGITKSSLHQDPILFHINRLYMWSLINQFSPLPIKNKKHLNDVFVTELTRNAKSLGVKNLILRFSYIAPYTISLIIEWLSNLTYRRQLQKLRHGKLDCNQ